MFARAIGDPNPVYSDPERAAGTRSGPHRPADVRAGQRPVRPRLRAPAPHRASPGSGRARPPPGLQRRRPPSRGGEGGGERAARGGGGSGLHAEQHYKYHRPLRVGDVLTATTTPGERWEKQGRRAGTLVFSESITEYRDQDGELVVTARSVAVRTERAVQQ